MSDPTADTWLRCSACRKEIAYGQVHWVCSVSTCNRSRTRLVFCSVACWDSHVATLRHRDAWAVEARAPSRAEAAAERSAEAAVRSSPAAPAAPAAAAAPASVRPPAAPLSEPAFRRVVTAPAGAPPAAAAGGAPAAPTLSEDYERDVLIVVSKMKKYIKERSGMNTSDAVADVLGEHVRRVCDDAIRAAAADGRKTVLDRDVPRPVRGTTRW